MDNSGVNMDMQQKYLIIIPLGQSIFLLHIFRVEVDDSRDEVLPHRNRANSSPFCGVLSKEKTDRLQSYFDNCRRVCHWANFDQMLLLYWLHSYTIPKGTNQRGTMCNSTTNDYRPLECDALSSSRSLTMLQKNAVNWPSWKCWQQILLKYW